MHFRCPLPPSVPCFQTIPLPLPTPAVVQFVEWPKEALPKTINEKHSYILRYNEISASLNLEIKMIKEHLFKNCIHH